MNRRQLIKGVAAGAALLATPGYGVLNGHKGAMAQVKAWVTPQDFDATAGTAGNATNDTAAFVSAIAACFGAGPTNQSSKLNRALGIPAPSNGTYQLTGGLQFPAILGGIIAGDGRFVTNIINSNNTQVFKFRSISDLLVRDLTLQATATAPAVIDVASDGLVLASQRCDFQRLYLQTGDIGFRMTEANNGQTSEFGFEDFFVSGSTTYGMSIVSYNSLGHTFKGGDIKSCGTGVLLDGAEMAFWGTGFQANTVWDVSSTNSADGALSMMGCRTESQNFVRTQGFRGATIDSCNQLYATDSLGYFARIEGLANLRNCVSGRGRVLSSSGGTIADSQFGLDAPFQFEGTNSNTISYGIDHVRIGRTFNGSGTGTARDLRRGRWYNGNGYVADF